MRRYKRILVDMEERINLFNGFQSSYMIDAFAKFKKISDCERVTHEEYQAALNNLKEQIQSEEIDLGIHNIEKSIIDE